MSTYREQSATYRDVRITVRERLNKDLYDSAAVIMKLDPESVEATFRRDQFARAVLQTASVENLPFAWVTLSSTTEETRAAYVNWCDMSPMLGKVWSDAIFDLNSAAIDQDLAPKLSTVGE